MPVTNGNVNIYTPRTMAPVFEKNMPVTTFFRDTFFGRVNTYPTEQVDVDSRKGERLIAPFVAPNIGGINMDRKGYQTKTYTPPKVAPQRTMNPEILQPRLMGETLHTTMTPEQRQDYFMQQDAQEMNDAISRREEVMCAELLNNGKIIARGYMDDDLTKYVDETIEYEFTNKTILLSQNQWNQTGSKKLDDLEAAVEKVFKAGYSTSMCILGADAWKWFKVDEEVQDLMDKINYFIGRIEPGAFQQNGLRYLGSLTSLGLELWAYYAWYKDYDGTLKPIMPADHVVVAPPDLGEMMYGAITQLEDDDRYHTYEGTRVPKLWSNKENDVKKYRIAARPMPKPFDIDAWAVLKVL